MSESQDRGEGAGRRRLMVFHALLVGLAAGGVAVAFRYLLFALDLFREAFFAWSHQFGTWGLVFPLAYSIGGATAGVWLVRRFAPEARGSGIPHLKGVLNGTHLLRWRRVLGVKFAGGLLAIGAGLALGREGPTVQLGGATGEALAIGLKLPPERRRTLIAAGAGAGLAAAFNAPWAGLLFVLEEFQRDFRPIVLVAAFLASLLGDLLSRCVFGQGPIYDSGSSQGPAPLGTLPVFVLIGGVSGLFSWVFHRGLMRTVEGCSKLSGRDATRFTILVGLLVGLAGWYTPIAIGSGHALTTAVLAEHVALRAVPFWFIWRLALTLASYGTGAAGGIFAPMLALGALIGAGVGGMVRHVFPEMNCAPDAFVVAGMAATLTAIVRAPLTALGLTLEMTGAFPQMLPMFVACFCAYMIAEGLRVLPIYEALLARLPPSGGPIQETERPTPTGHLTGTS